MSVKANASSELRVRQVVRWSYILLRTKFWFWVIFTIVVHILSYVAIDALKSIPEYFKNMLGVDIWKFKVMKLLDDAIKSIYVEFHVIIDGASFYHGLELSMIFVFLLYFILLQITVNGILRDIAAQEFKCLTSDQFATCLRRIDIISSPTVLFEGNFLRKIAGICGIFLIFFAYCAIVMKLWNIIVNVNFVLSFAFILIANIVLIYLSIRYSLAIPVSVNENRGVFASIRQSWNMTNSCKMKITLLYLVAILLIGAILLTTTIPITLFGYSFFHLVIWIVGLISIPLVLTVFMSITYYALRRDLGENLS